MEERQLALKAAFPSLFEFCIGRLGFSEGEAFRRMTAARLVRRFPIVLTLLEEGAVHMSGLVLLRNHLTNENHEELLREAAHKSKREILEMLARRFPRADVPTTVTPLSSEALALCNAMPTGNGGTSSPAPEGMPKAEARVEPFAPTRYLLEATIPDVLREKLDRATALLRHRNPKGDLVVLEHAVDALLERLERERLGRKKATPGATRTAVLAAEATTLADREKPVLAATPDADVAGEAADPAAAPPAKARAIGNASPSASAPANRRIPRNRTAMTVLTT